MDTSNITAVELMYKVAQKIDDEPENYDQHTYMCETRHCIAGWAIAIGVPNGLEELQEFFGKNKDNLDPHAAAAALLGLGEDEAYALFHALWNPKKGMTVGDALRKLANGAELYELSVTDMALDRFDN